MRKPAAIHTGHGSHGTVLMWAPLTSSTPMPSYSPTQHFCFYGLRIHTHLLTASEMMQSLCTTVHNSKGRTSVTSTTGTAHIHCNHVAVQTEGAAHIM